MGKQKLLTPKGKTIANKLPSILGDMFITFIAPIAIGYMILSGCSDILTIAANSYLADKITTEAFFIILSGLLTPITISVWAWLYFMRKWYKGD